MHINGQPWRTIWLESDQRSVGIIDQTKLPHQFETVCLRTVEEAAHAIRAMLVRGAPLIGAAAAWGMFLGLLADSSDAGLDAVCAKLLRARPTAVNLRWAVERMRQMLALLPPAARTDAARREAAAICEEDVQVNEAIGEHGLRLIEEQYRRTGQPVNILTHCNAGWLATVDWGTALSPVFKAQQAGIPLHVWVDETRPRNQGAQLTAWELASAGIDHHLIADNSGGWLMRQGQRCCPSWNRKNRRGQCNIYVTSFHAQGALRHPALLSSG